MKPLAHRFIEVRAAFAVFVLFLVYFNPPQIVAVFFLAAGLHEMAHLLVLRMLGVQVRAIRLGFADMQIVTGMMPAGTQVLSALAGPVMNLLCFLVFRIRFSDFAAMSVLLGLFNLLPILPLDGGRALHAGLLLFFSEKTTNRAVLSIGLFCCAILMVFACRSCAVSILPIALVCLLFVRMFTAYRQEIAVAFA